MLAVSPRCDTVTEGQIHFIPLAGLKLQIIMQRIIQAVSAWQCKESMDWHTLSRPFLSSIVLFQYNIRIRVILQPIQRTSLYKCFCILRIVLQFSLLKIFLNACFTKNRYVFLSAVLNICRPTHCSKNSHLFYKYLCAKKATFVRIILKN